VWAHGHERERGAGTLRRKVGRGSALRRTWSQRDKTITFLDDHVVEITDDAVGRTWIRAFDTERGRRRVS